MKSHTALFFKTNPLLWHHYWKFFDRAENGADKGRLFDCLIGLIRDYRDISQFKKLGFFFKA